MSDENYMQIDMTKLDDSSVSNKLKGFLNSKFSDMKCRRIIYTNNSDYMLFGIVVLPEIKNISSFLINGDDLEYGDYYDIEIDSKLDFLGLTDDEFISCILFNVHNILNRKNISNQLRIIVDTYLTDMDTQVSIVDSLKYEAILKFGLVDTLIKITSFLYIDGYVSEDAYMDSIGLGDIFNSALLKVFNELNGYENTASKYPKLIIMDWCFRLYKDVEHKRISAIKHMENIRDFSGSVLYKSVINGVIQALFTINTDSVNESAAIEKKQNLLIEGNRVGSIFSQIKYNGLRGIEDDIYEFIVRARNAETEDEVMYALKQINVRLSILDDYIRYENMSDIDKKRWTDLYMKYCEIRDNIAQKKVYNKKNYGIFIDYNKLDEEDDY